MWKYSAKCSIITTDMNNTNDIISAYIENLYIYRNEALKELRNFAEQNHVPIILKDTEGLLRALMKLKKPAQVLEIGTAVGYSSCVFVDACGCNVTTVELESNMADTAELNIRNLGFEKCIKVVRGDAIEYLDRLNKESESKENIRFDAVFIDAAKSHYREFWDLSMPFVSQDGIIICDNVLMKGMTASEEFDTKHRYKTSIRNMRDFITYINGLDYAETTILPVGDGVSVSLINKRHPNK